MPNNEIDLYNGGELAPVNNPLQPLAPSPDTWGNTQLTPREIDDYQSQRSGGLQLFGEPMPPGTTPQQVQATLGEVAGVYLSDFSKLGHPNKLIQSAISFFMENATKPPRQVRRNHSFNLHDQAGDWLAESFGNFLHSLSGTQASKQKFLSDSLWWLGELNKKLGANQQQVGTQPPRTAPHSTEALLSQLSEADYNKVVAINDKALANTMQVLQQRWGEYTFRQNIEIAQNYLNSLPANEQKHFDQFTTGWVHMRNTPEFIIAMFDAATGAHSLPRDGAGIAREIAECERCMKTNRKQWLADSALQARYRTLLQMRG